ncbi:lysylphosphatidylglycerol synthase transmembrane domain-containing protein [Agrilutibacter solisilvae]|uniref:UPF0104 family protein n=1 Tax=Agrilutibacter solisilvae TaxID=2763317 RepID=A0A974Y0P5_9GAMM|nr:YbhN family protein [Lysobacter solisilvae]QSX79257.1 UPF0104 family protein [Lysobacter solisilvae]
MKPRHRRWRRVARIAFFAFLALVGWLLVRAARAIAWDEVGAALTGYGPATLGAAGALVVASYAVYAGYDLAARRYAHHRLSTPRVVAIAVISYAFSLNIGALVGGAGFRYRLYSHSGLGVGPISRVIAFSVATNWLGYVLLGGVLFATRSVAAPPGWEMGTTGLQWVGMAMLLLTAAYLAACHWLHERVYHLRGHHFRVPTLPMAVVQFGLSCANWSLMAWIIDLLLPPAVPYPTVLGVLLLAGIASAMAHIPAGIGVLEAVFVAMLGHLVPPAQLLAALLGYRGLYYLAPLLVAVVMYLVFEARGKRPQVGTGADPQVPSRAPAPPSG